MTWFEILGTDAARTQAFYAELFGWKIEDMMPGYGVVNFEAFGFGGAVGATEQAPSYATIYPQVSSADGTAKEIVAEGGTLVMQPTDIQGADARVAMFNDPQGNLLGIFQPLRKE